MGRNGSGVQVRETSIRIAFTLDGRHQRHTLMVNGEPMLPTPANLRYAERLAGEIREKIRFGTFVPADYFPVSGAGPGHVTVGNQLDTFLSSQRLESSTRNGYVSIINFWKAELGDKPLRALKHSDVLTVLARLPDLSGKTLNNRMSVLRKALQLAVMDRVLTENPAENLPSAKWQRQPVDPFSAEEVEAILADMRKHYPPRVVAYTEAKFFTGLRTGESFGLRWPNVDLVRRQILVAESVVSGEEKATTKTKVARTVLLNSRAFEAIKGERERTYLKGGHVFTDPRDDQRWGGEPKFRWFWVPTLKRLGIRHRPPYNTRHSYATMMLMAGMTPAFCAGQMGHSVEIFLRTYAKWIPGTGDAAEMAKLEARISGADQARTG